LIILLLLILGIVFFLRRKAHRREQAALAAQRKRKESRNLLDGEGFYDDDGAQPFMGTVSNFSRPSLVSSGAVPRAASPSPSHLRSRASESGSVFREEVWPPPQDEIVDPIRRGSSQVDLSIIVDHVMGSPGHQRRATEPPIGGGARAPLDHRRRVSTVSTSSDSLYAPSITSQFADPFLVYGTGAPPVPPLGGAAPLPAGTRLPSRSPSPSSSRADPFASSSAAHLTAPPSPAAALPPARSASPTSAPWISTSQPRNSSPLARALTQDAAKLWLTRSPHPVGSRRGSEASLPR